MNECERCTKLTDDFLALRSVHASDIKYYIIALNLTGKRKELEEKAYELINKHGELKALKLSKRKVTDGL